MASPYCPECGNPVEEYGMLCEFCDFDDSDFDDDVIEDEKND